MFSNYPLKFVVCILRGEFCWRLLQRAYQREPMVLKCLRPLLSGVTVSPAAERLRYILSEDDDLPTPTLFTEMDTLQREGDELEWKESARLVTAVPFLVPILQPATRGWLIQLVLVLLVFTNILFGLAQMDEEYSFLLFLLASVSVC